MHNRGTCRRLSLGQCNFLRQEVDSESIEIEEEESRTDAQQQPQIGSIGEHVDDERKSPPGGAARCSGDSGDVCADIDEGRRPSGGDAEGAALPPGDWPVPCFRISLSLRHLEGVEGSAQSPFIKNPHEWFGYAPL